MNERRMGDREPWRCPERFNPDNEGWARPVSRRRHHEGALKEVAGAARDFGKRLRQILVTDKPH
ncbi:hypothetical protein FN976_21940 [Caenimonas sedimenti]|uniref:Uncharacterized protein n=1 Tax=Caenimonas sedimenti TaxID=2596921 RepID=A0A562ZJB3_9BURK|nr:hypothetical protein [Caenimonas sedimenti]TWO68669.1 hypothetical protein FN976_21940 [Caenimonas sedimenti]